MQLFNPFYIPFGILVNSNSYMKNMQMHKLMCLQCMSEKLSMNTLTQIIRHNMLKKYGCTLYRRYNVQIPNNMHFHAKEMKHLIKTFLHKHFMSSPMLQTVLGRIFFVRTSTPNVGNLLDNYIMFDKSLFFGTNTQECKSSDSPLKCVCSEFKRNYPDNKEYLEEDGHICLRMRNHPEEKVSKLGALGANYTPWLSNSELIRHMKANLNDFF